MQIGSDRLLERLRTGPLDALYFFYGDEPLQLTEAADALRARAAREGIGERRVFDVDAGADWDAIENESSALSLFATRRLLEIRLGTRGPDKRGVEALERIAGACAGADVFLVLAGALDGRARQARWFKRLEQDAVCMAARDLKPGELPDWLGRRAAHHGKRLSRAAAELVAERVEGNLLAAAQEIEKLCLVVTDEAIDEAAVMHAVTDSARFDVYQLVDALLGADLARALRIVRGLRAEGTEPPLVTWALGRELRQLAGMAAARARGAPLDKVLDDYRVWSNRKGLVRRALERHDEDALLRLLAYANVIDAMAKGGRTGAPWDELEILALCLCGVRRAARLMPAL